MTVEVFSTPNHIAKHISSKQSQFNPGKLYIFLVGEIKETADVIVEAVQDASSRKLFFTVYGIEGCEASQNNYKKVVENLEESFGFKFPSGPAEVMGSPSLSHEKRLLTRDAFEQEKKLCLNPSTKAQTLAAVREQWDVGAVSCRLQFQKFSKVTAVVSLLTGVAAGAYYAYKTGIMASIAFGSFNVSLLVPPLLVALAAASILATVLMISGLIYFSCKNKNTQSSCWANMFSGRGNTNSTSLNNNGHAAIPMEPL